MNENQPDAMRDVPSVGLVSTSQLNPKENRQRLIELSVIADKVLTLAEELGVKPNEQCRFGNICQDMWRR